MAALVELAAHKTEKGGSSLSENPPMDMGLVVDANYVANSTNITYISKLYKWL